MSYAYSSGLTSLREPVLSSRVLPEDFITPHQKELMQLKEIRSEIALLITQKKNLFEDIKKLNPSVDKSKERRELEIKKLKSEKMKLLAEIRNITASMLDMKKNRRKIIKGFEDFGQDRSKETTEFSRRLTMENKRQLNEIRRESQLLQNRRSALIGLKTNYDQLIKQTEVERQSYEKQRKEYVIEKDLLLLKEKEISVKLDEAREREEKTKNIISDIEKIKKEAADYKKYWQDKLEKLRKDLEEKLKTQATEEKIIEAEKRGLNLEKDRLKIKERQLLDKERTLKRAAEEIERKML